MVDHAVVSREEWIAARKELLAEEKRLTRIRDELNERRRGLPWVKVEREYVFEGPSGPVTLADLFGGRSQLIVQHFMFSPDWEEGCVGCSFHADHVDGTLPHLEHHDVSFAKISRAPIAKIEAFNRRMGWKARWVSSFGNSFNFDYHVSLTKDEVANGTGTYNYAKPEHPIEELSGMSVFVRKPDGSIYHTYSCYARGDEGALTTYHYLDLTPKGRNENGPRFNLTDWVRHHDRYDEGFVDVTSLFSTGKLVYEARS